MQIYILLNTDDFSSQDIKAWMKKVKKACPKNKNIYLQSPFTSNVVSDDDEDKKFIKLIIQKRSKKYQNSNK